MYTEILFVKRVVFLLIIIAGAVSFAVACARSDEVITTPVTIYYVDAEINRLLPYDDEIPDADTEHMAAAAVEKLIKGRDDNDKIRRLIPKDKDCISTRTDGNTVYVDLSSKITEDLPFSRDIEKLLIYQIVDTLTSLKGVRFVRFTVDGEVRKDFMGYYDMRETYKFVYPE